MSFSAELCTAERMDDTAIFFEKFFNHRGICDLTHKRIFEKFDIILIAIL